MKELTVVDGKYIGDEGLTLEFKSALKGISNSTWETYSSFANTFGGRIIHGINNETHEIEGVPNVELRLQEIWNSLNNPQIVNYNILRPEDVWVKEIDGKSLIIMDVPRAELCLRPIYYKALETGTFKRNGEGDYRCTLSEIGSMFRDKSDTTYDFTALDGTTFDDIDMESFHSFRNKMNVSKPGHKWNNIDDLEFARKIGVVSRSGNEDELTVAGLLMFGKEYAIYPYFPRYKLDYQEIPEKWPDWHYRLVTGDAMWEGNIYNYYTNVISRLTIDLPSPFVIGPNMQRISDTDVHKAVRECFLNAITNADYLGELVIRIQKYPDHIVISNSGLFRVPLAIAEKGGTSSIRNSLIARMFSFIDLTERAGSGVNFIFDVWGKSFGNRPVVNEDTGSQTVTFELYTKTMSKAHGFDECIMEMMNTDPHVTVKRISKSLSVSPSTVAYHIKNLIGDGRIERVGGTRGYWKVI